MREEPQTPLSELSGHTLTVAAIDVCTGRASSRPSPTPRSQPTMARAYTMARASDGTTLCSGSRDTTVRVWDIATAKETFRSTLSRNLVMCAQHHTLHRLEYTPDTCCCCIYITQVTCMQYFANEPAFVQVQCRCSQLRASPQQAIVSSVVK